MADKPRDNESSLTPQRDEATIAHLEEEARSIQLGDASPQTAPEEVRDLEMK